MPHWHAAIAAARCGADTETTTDASPTTASQSENSWLIAGRTASRLDSSAGCARRSAAYTSSTVERSGTWTVSASMPACSRSRAKSRVWIATATVIDSILGSHEHVDFFAGVERALDSGARALRAAIPERHQHIARVDQPLVAR